MPRITDDFGPTRSDHIAKSRPLAFCRPCEPRTREYSPSRSSDAFAGPMGCFLSTARRYAFAGPRHTTCQLGNGRHLAAAAFPVLQSRFPAGIDRIVRTRNRPQTSGISRPPVRNYQGTVRGVHFGRVPHCLHFGRQRFQIGGALKCYPSSPSSTQCANFQENARRTEQVGGDCPSVHGTPESSATDAPDYASTAAPHGLMDLLVKEVPIFGHRKMHAYHNGRGVDRYVKRKNTATNAEIHATLAAQKSCSFSPIFVDLTCSTDTARTWRLCEILKNSTPFFHAAKATARGGLHDDHRRQSCDPYLHGPTTITPAFTSQSLRTLRRKRASTSVIRDTRADMAIPRSRNFGCVSINSGKFVPRKFPRLEKARQTQFWWKWRAVARVFNAGRLRFNWRYCMPTCETLAS